MAVFKSQVIYGALVCVTIFGFSNVAAEDFCKNPRNANNIDRKWIEDNGKSGFRIQFGSPPLRKRFAQWLLGRKFNYNSNDNYAQLCAKDQIRFLDQRNIVGNFTGFNNKIAIWNCLESNKQYRCDIISSNPDYSDTANIYMTYIDDKKEHNLMGIAFCFSDGSNGYMALTSGKTISDQETNTIINHFESIGFHTDSRISMHQPSCK